MKTTAKTLQMLQMPKIELMNFDFDPLKYWRFVCHWSVGRPIRGSATRVDCEYATMSDSQDMYRSVICSALSL